MRELNEYRWHGNVMQSLIFRRVGRRIVKRRLRTQLAVQPDVALRLDVVLAALGDDSNRRPDEQLDVLRHLALPADNLSFQWRTSISGLL